MVEKYYCFSVRAETALSGDGPFVCCVKGHIYERIIKKESFKQLLSGIDQERLNDSGLYWEI